MEQTCHRSGDSRTAVSRELSILLGQTTTLANTRLLGREKMIGERTQRFRLDLQTQPRCLPKRDHHDDDDDHHHRGLVFGGFAEHVLVLRGPEKC